MHDSSSMSTAQQQAGWWRSPVLLALLFTALGSIKPIHIDEACYYYFARHIARNPLDPLRFQVLWYEVPQDANSVLAPPVMVSWWALGMYLLRSFGEHPVLWKVWLLPFVLLFVFSLHALLRRFARGLERPLLWMTVLSPVILPGLNLMPDVPALALSLCAVVMFLRAIDQRGASAWGLAVLAGLLAGLGMQTKYTGFLAPGALLLAAIVRGRPFLWPLAAGPAALVFVAWELLTDRLYGESHFLLQLRYSSQTLEDKAALVLPLLSTVGGVAPVVGLLGLAGLGVSRAGMLAAGGVVGLGFVAVAATGITFNVEVPFQGPFDISLPDLIYTTWGLAMFGILAAVAWRLGRGLLGGDPGRYDRRDDWFLILWLALEVVGYFPLTPFPAVRRVMGLVVVATLLAGRLASRGSQAPERQRAVKVIAAFNMSLGLMFYVVDLIDAHAQKEAAETASAFIRREVEGSKVWYAGHWGFQYYAEHAAMEPVVPDRSELQAGDWLVLPDARIDQQHFVVDEHRTGPAFRHVVRDWVPLKTVANYYGGWTPLDHKQGSRLEVEVRRVTANHVPASPR
jgi:hypothetical protein